MAKLEYVDEYSSAKAFNVWFIADRYAKLPFKISPIKQQFKEFNSLVGYIAFGVPTNLFQTKLKDGKIIAAKFAYLSNHTLSKAAKLWFQ